MTILLNTYIKSPALVILVKQIIYILNLILFAYISEKDFDDDLTDVSLVGSFLILPFAIKTLMFS